MKMKKLFSFIMLGAIALVGATTFNSCSSEEAAPVNPTFDGESVKTQFSIALPGNVSKTRMSYETVQGSEAIADFRGMENIVLVPYKDATSRTTRFGDNITLWYGTQAKPESTTNAENSIPNGKLLANSNAVLFNDVSVPLNTSGFLFYGKATGTDGYENGFLVSPAFANTDQIGAFNFSPKPIVDAPVTTKGDNLAAYVTLIANAAPDDQTTYPGSSWAACAVSTNHTTANQAWYNADLGELYTNFIALKAGASAYVQAAVQDLFSSIYVSTNPVAVAIRTKILTKATDDGTGKLTFDTTISDYPSDATSAILAGTTPTGAPNNFMPDGAAALKWDGTNKKFDAIASNTNTGTNVNMTVDMATVAYPASLWYFVDSKLKTANASKKDKYEGAANWDAILAEYTDGTSVAASTRSIAIEDPIQYGVGRLDTKVSKLDPTKTYYDRQGNVVTVTNGFTLTGVLIGGQKAVNYDFTQTTSSTATEYTIYDKTINTSTNGSASLTTTTDAGTNYTLALETKDDQVVNVALEFLNLGDDFYGVDGIVKKNCKFYMIAQLDPTDGTTGNGVKPSGFTENKVFKQDHKTIANFSIAAGDDDTDNDGWAESPAGFANAYVTIPDLRTPLLELGFSVDLKWEEGITFTHEF